MVRSEEKSQEENESLPSVSRRPRSITLIGLLFIAAGIVGFVYHAMKYDTRGPFDYGQAWVLVVRLLAVVGGVFVLRGANWSRWLLLGWMAYHVYLSALHTTSELVMHAVLTVVIAFVLFRSQGAGYFADE